MYISVKEAIELVGVSQATLYREINRGNLETIGTKEKDLQIDLESAYKLRERRKKGNE